MSNPNPIVVTVELKNIRAIADLIVKWQRLARKKFEDAKHETDPMGRRLIEHGATCYANAALELAAAIGCRPKPKS
jgi:hypothetical protein